MSLDALLADLLDQERRLVFRRFDNDTAIALGLAIVEEARRRALAVTVNVTRAGQQIFHMALPGTTADNDQWIARKTAVVMRFGHSSYLMGRKAVQKGLPFHEAYLVDPLLYAAHGGCFPVVVDGTGLVGTVTVSGLPQEDDHALVVTVLERFLAAESVA